MACGAVRMVRVLKRPCRAPRAGVASKRSAGGFVRRASSAAVTTPDTSAGHQRGEAVLTSRTGGPSSHTEHVPTDRQAAAALLRALLAEVEGDRLRAESAHARRLLRRLEGALIALDTGAPGADRSSGG